MGKTNRQRIATAGVIGLLCLAGGASTALSGQQAQIEIGTDTGAQSIRLALPLFPLQERGDENPPEPVRLTQVFNETLWNDLEFSGIFELVGRSFYPLGSFGNTGDILPADWTTPEVDAQILAFGHAEIDDNGMFFVESHLWDVQTDSVERELMSGAGIAWRVQLSEAGVRITAHNIADRIVRELGGGVLGIARTQIAFASDRTTRPDDEFRRKRSGSWTMTGTINGN